MFPHQVLRGCSATTAARGGGQAPGPILGFEVPAAWPSPGTCKQLHPWRSRWSRLTRAQLFRCSRRHQRPKAPQQRSANVSGAAPSRLPGVHFQSSRCSLLWLFRRSQRHQQPKAPQRQSGENNGSARYRLPRQQPLETYKGQLSGFEGITGAFAREPPPERPPGVPSHRPSSRRPPGVASSATGHASCPASQPVPVPAHSAPSTLTS